MLGFDVELHRRSTSKVFQDAKSGKTWVKYLFELYVFNSSVHSTVARILLILFSEYRERRGYVFETENLEHFPTGMNRLGFPKRRESEFKLYAGEGGQHAWPRRFPLIFAKG